MEEFSIIWRSQAKLSNSLFCKEHSEFHMLSMIDFID